ncbi:MAG: hypothetical protein IPI60_06090 [Saprospiraceae bacterium]|nr:hypothetical protein [Saprospiraceae bacterium]
MNGRVGDLRIATDGLIYAGVYSTGIFRSESGVSGSWQRMNNGFPTTGFNRVEFAVCEKSPNVLYATLAGPNGNVSQAWYDLSVGIDPNNPDRVFIGGIDILVSANGGLNWDQLTQWFGGSGLQYAHADQHNIVFSTRSSNVIYFTNDGGIYRTTNGAALNPNVRFVSDGYNVTQFYACAVHPEEEQDWFLAGAQDNGTQLFREEG